MQTQTQERKGDPHQGPSGPPFRSRTLTFPPLFPLRPDPKGALQRPATGRVGRIILAASITIPPVSMQRRPRPIGRPISTRCHVHWGRDPSVDNSSQELRTQRTPGRSRSERGIRDSAAPTASLPECCNPRPVAFRPYRFCVSLPPARGRGVVRGCRREKRGLGPSPTAPRPDRPSPSKPPRHPNLHPLPGVQHGHRWRHRVLVGRQRHLQLRRPLVFRLPLQLIPLFRRE